MAGLGSEVPKTADATGGVPSSPRGLLSSVKGGIYDGIFKGLPGQGCSFLGLHLQSRGSDLHVSLCLPHIPRKWILLLLSLVSACLCLLESQARSYPLWHSCPHLTSWHRSTLPDTGLHSTLFVYPNSPSGVGKTDASCRCTGCHSFPRQIFG